MRMMLMYDVNGLEYQNILGENPSLMRRSNHPNHFLTSDEQALLQQAVSEAEMQTSAQIKVVMVRHCWGKLNDKAAKLFTKYGLDQLPDRNGVLILLVLANRELLIYGDQGINEKVTDDFWVSIHTGMVKAFKANEMGSGLANGIKQIGKALEAYFPKGDDHDNPVDDQVAFEA